MAGLRTNSNIVRDPETEINAVAECAAPIVLAGYMGIDLRRTLHGLSVLDPATETPECLNRLEWNRRDGPSEF